MITSLQKPRFLALFLLLALVVVVVRFYHLGDRVTHNDDIGWIRNNWDSAENFQWNAPEAVKAGYSVARIWTYATWQFIFGHPILRMAKTWEELVIFARLPSALFSTTGILLMFIGLWRIHGGKWPFLLTVFPCTLAAFSLRSILDAQTGYNYASTALVMGVQFLILTFIPPAAENKFKWAIVFSLLMVVAVNSSFLTYQAIASAIVLALAVVISDKSLIRSPRNLLLFLPIFLLAAYYGFNRIDWLWSKWILPRVDGRDMIGWTAEYPTVQWSWNIFLTTYSLVSYFFLRLYEVLLYGLSPLWTIWAGKVWKVLFGVPLVILWIIGALSIFRKTLSLPLRSSALFSLGMTATLFISNLAGKTPFGGTRHSHILMIPCLILISVGLKTICEFLTKKSDLFFNRVGLALVASVSVIFLLGYSAFHTYTKSNYDLQYIRDVESQNNIIGIVSSASIDEFNVAIVKVAFSDTLLKSRVFFEIDVALKQVANAKIGESILVVSPNVDPQIDVQRIYQDLRLTGLSFEMLKAVKPIGGINLKAIGNPWPLNNGFYVLKITKEVESS